MEYLHDQFSLAVKLTWKMPALITPAALLIATIHCSSCADTAVQGLLWCLTTMVKTLAPTRLWCFNPLFHGPILKQHPTFCWADTKEGCKTRVKCYCRWLLHWRNTRFSEGKKKMLLLRGVDLTFWICFSLRGSLEPSLHPEMLLTDFVMICITMPFSSTISKSCPILCLQLRLK